MDESEEMITMLTCTGHLASTAQQAVAADLVAAEASRRIAGSAWRRPDR